VNPERVAFSATFEAIVPAVLVGLVGEAVELRADLPDLGNDDLLVAPAPVGELVHERAFDVHIETPRTEERHIRIEHVSEFYDLAGLDQLDCVEHRLRLHVVGGAALVVRAPLGGTALVVRRRRPARSLRQDRAAGRQHCAQHDPKCDGLHGFSSPCACSFRMWSGRIRMRSSRLSFKQPTRCRTRDHNRHATKDRDRGTGHVAARG